ncbi:MAG: sulfurtransferase TusA family protein [Nitrospirae bacterium]|nr:sulfurtransferase TusA family protein [Nitrospirota bacterium]MBF0536042.1 sulfurtransferase TusA family protein [Nitrospirota bacterium]MBF0617930.1 sulfurtransferase TusA family protein [Nitrospirota bacterium]
MTEQQVSKTVDCTGMSCPMPVIKTKKGIEGITVGQVLKVISTDMGAKNDIPALISRLGHKLKEIKEDGRTLSFYIEKTGGISDAIN